MRQVTLLVLSAALVAGPIQPAMAGSLLEAGTRLAAEAGRRTVADATVARAGSAEQEPAAAAPGGRRKKIALVIAIAVAAGVAMYAIDRGVVDNTPSTKGTRKD